MNYSPMRTVLLAALVIALAAGCAATALRIGAGGLGRMAVASGARMGATAAVGRSVASASVLRSGLRGLTSGRAPAVISITRNGSVLHRGRTLATIESDGLLVTREGGREYILGRLTQNRLWALTESGQLSVPVARLRGFVASRGIAIRSAPSASAPRVEILRGNVTAEVLQARDGWYEIRLPNQSTGWVWGALVALAVLHDDDSDESRPSDAGTDALVVLQNGQSIRASAYRVEAGAVHVWDERGLPYTFDENVVSHTVPFSELPAPDEAPIVELANGTAIVGVARAIDTGAVAIDSPTGHTMIVDAGLLKTVPQTVEQQAAVTPEPWRSRSW